MKNKHFERRRKLAKAWLKKHGQSMRLTDGVRIYHIYDEDKALSYWDDFCFVLGSQKVIVTWIHPRMALIDAIEQMAFAKANEELGHPDCGTLFEKSDKAIVKKVGKSRKKTVAWEMNPFTASFTTWNSRVTELKKSLYSQGAEPIVSRPSINVDRWDSGRHVSITYPVELLSEADVIAFAHKVKAHLKGEIDLFAGLDDYAYTNADYRREHPKEFEQEAK